jgi:hypothetical protein
MLGRVVLHRQCLAVQYYKHSDRVILDSLPVQHRSRYTRPYEGRGHLRTRTGPPVRGLRMHKARA